MANKDWMGALDDDRALNTLVMPGSHDASMYECKAGTSQSTVNGTITQFDDFAVQLEAGARFFDIRIYKTGGVLRAGHFASKSRAIIGAYGPTFADILQEFPRFLTRHRGETVILKISLSKSASADAVRLIETQWTNFLFESSAPRALAAATLGQLRQKIVVVFDKPTGTVTKKMHVASKTVPAAGTLPTGRSTLWLQGEAPKGNRIAKVVAKQNVERAKVAGARLAPHLAMFYLTITASKGDVVTGKSCVADNTAREFGLTGAARSTEQAKIRGKYSAWNEASGEKYADKIQVGPGSAAPNIYMVDFVNDDVCSEILKISDSVLSPTPKFVPDDDEGYEADDEEELEEPE